MTPALRVACDTNVLVSAFIAAGPPSRIIEKASDGEIQLVLLEPVMDELERVLRQKLGFEEDRWHEVDALLREVAIAAIPAPPGPPEEVSGDRDDDVVLASACAADISVLVSGDRKHLLPLGDHRGVRILTPQAVLAESAGSSYPERR
ncbi:MAG TPA: putative toxin-antitoxin system toxin component, PIN family [Solirubrobacterales bacterium]|nr:putative toxin-antitoxin system toxin component, PIN family [Solirubrobacterales bacterium]